ncbi:MAG: GntR family transcriptional regulator [Bradyrhizobium sp.]|nr:GntR family transcriptional regulator [Bradyrhizobium sp.]
MSKSSSLSHQVANDLRRDIIAGVLAPGSWLKTDELAERYSVSANPVREALWKLQGEGFVVANPNQGARVRVVDDDFVRNIFEVREAIEPIFMRRFCHRVTRDDLARLHEAATRFAEAASSKEPDFAEIDAANRSFHAIITEGEINLQAIEVMERYAGLISATRSKLPISPAGLRNRVMQHAEIAKAIESGDVTAAITAATAHVRAACEDMLNQMRQIRTSTARVAAAEEPARPKRRSRSVDTARA